MKKFFVLLPLLSIVTLAILFFISPSLTSAEETAQPAANSATENMNNSAGRNYNIPLGSVKKLSPSNIKSTIASRAGTRKALLKIRLDQAKLRLCQVREKVITNRSSKMVQHANRLMTVFDSIATRIQNYYLTRLVPRGKTLPNYDALILNIQNKKNAINPLLETAQSDVNNFNCEGDDPKGQLALFRQDMKAVIAALKAYKTAVKNLIVAVASLGGTERGTATGSATPTLTPEVTQTAEPTL